MSYKKNMLVAFLSIFGLLHQQPCHTSSITVKADFSLPSLQTTALCGGVALAGYLAYYYSPLILDIINPHTKIATIFFNTAIGDSFEYADKLTLIKEAEEIDGLLLIINSGGGVPGESELMARIIGEIRIKKPVVVFVVDSCCSGAYLMACPATAIVALGTSSLGCIGVNLTSIKSFPEKFNSDDTSGELEVYPFSAGKYKSIHNAHTHLTDEEKEEIQREVDALYDVFVNFVAQERDLDVNKKDLWAEGKIFTGPEALRLNLIDAVGGIDDAIAILKAKLEEAGKSSEKIQWLNL